MTAVPSPFIELLEESRADVRPWWERRDPVLETTWIEGVQLKWSEHSISKHVLKPDGQGRLAHVDENEFSPILLPHEEAYEPDVIAAMGVLNEWGQLTTFQVSALLSLTPDRTWEILRRLYSGGLLLRSVPPWWTDDPEDSGTGSIWRAHRHSWTYALWFDRLAETEWVRSTNGIEPDYGTGGSTTPSANLHNSATNEIAIRAMEACPGVVGAWSDRHAEGISFLPPHVAKHWQGRANVGDAVVVGRGGELVVLEVTGAANLYAHGDRIKEKAATWAAICGHSQLDLKVVFVDITGLGHRNQLAELVRKGVESGVKRLLANVTDRAKARDRVLVVEDEDWFPLTRGIGSAFRTLRSLSPVAGEWRDLIPLETTESELSDAVVNTLSAQHTPNWLRAAHGFTPNT